MKIPLSKISLTQNEIKEIEKTLNSGWITHGPVTEQFEKEFAEYIGSKLAVAVNSCTSALELVLMGMDIKGEVILPSNTWVASFNSIALTGHKAVFVDIDEKTFNIDPKKIREAISKDTVAIMPIHYAGLAANMDEITRIANDYNLTIIEDSAETLGGSIHDKKTGSFGIGCFSFFPTKNITTGEGGMITTDDEEKAIIYRAVRAHGIVKSTFDREKALYPWLKNASYAGHNYRISDLLSTLGLNQLKRIESLNKQRNEIAKIYKSTFDEIEEIQYQYIPKNFYHSYQMFVIRFQSKKISRDDFVLTLRNHGIGASVHFAPSVHLQEVVKYYPHKIMDMSVTEKLANEFVTLPLFPDMKQEEVDYLIKTIKDVL
jgi:perosamine synthetase